MNTNTNSSENPNNSENQEKEVSNKNDRLQMLAWKARMKKKKRKMELIRRLNPNRQISNDNLPLNFEQQASTSEASTSNEPKRKTKKVYHPIDKTKKKIDREKKTMAFYNDALKRGTFSRLEVAELIENYQRNEYQKQMDKFEIDVSSIYTENIEEYGNHIKRLFESKIKLLERQLEWFNAENIKLRNKDFKNTNFANCVTCKAQLNSLDKLSSSCSIHDVDNDIDILNESFDSVSEFYNWKSLIERENFTNLIKVADVKKTDTSLDASIMYFRCELPCDSHMGRFISKDNVNHMNRWCRSYVVAIIDESGKVDVRYCFNHTHNSESECITKIGKKNIQTLIDLGLSCQEILQCLSYVDPCNRIFRTNTNDLIRVLKEYSTIKVRGYTLTPLLSRIASECESNGIRMFIPPFNTDGRGFCLVMINENHLNTLRSFSERGIFVQRIPNTVGLQLISINVVDENLKIIPAAFMFSDKYDIRVLFYQIKKLYEEFNPKYLISHENVLNSFFDIFPGKRTKNFCCDDLIRFNINAENINNKERENIVEKLRNLLKRKYYVGPGALDEFVVHCFRNCKKCYWNVDSECINMDDIVEMIFYREDVIKEVVPEVKVEAEINNIDPIGVKGMSDKMSKNAPTIEDEIMEEDSKDGIVEWHKLVSELTSINFVPSKASNQLLKQMTNIWEEFQ